MDESKYLEQFSDEQMKTIDCLQQRVVDIDRKECQSKAFISRWLRAREWNLDEAEKMLRNDTKWRVENRVDDILDWFRVSEVTRKYFPVSYFGRDKEGHPVTFALIGRMEPKSFWMSERRADFMLSRIYSLEYAAKVLFPECSKREGKYIDKICVLLDLDQMSRKHVTPFSLSLAAEWVTMLEAHYPENLAAAYILNAPRIFNTMFNFFKPFLGPATQAKIHVFTSDYHELSEYLDFDTMPAYYGGKLYDPDGDPRCSSHICWGGPVPESYFLKDETHASNPTDGVISVIASSANTPMIINQNMVSVVIRRSSQCNIPLGLLSPHTKLDLALLCEKWDIKVSITGDSALEVTEASPQKSTSSPRSSISSLTGQIPNSSESSVSDNSGAEKANSTSTVILPPKRVANKTIPYRYHYEIEAPGFYTLIFDNSYSWVRSKKIRYVMQITMPSAMAADDKLAGEEDNTNTDNCKNSEVSGGPEKVNAVQNGDLRIAPPEADLEQSVRNNVNAADKAEVHQCDTQSAVSVNRTQSLDRSSKPRRHSYITGGSTDVNIDILHKICAELFFAQKFTKNEQKPVTPVLTPVPRK
ncbi:unnamed protein product [Calicophoron daubneyi]|uniref:CRAL-TRIO domain-containing protein n=1 Tax=Calicophoron daubneyi TaxID=300641 RepID=A0AAV2TLN2_CALDB